MSRRRASNRSTQRHLHRLPATGTATWLVSQTACFGQEGQALAPAQEHLGKRRAAGSGRSAREVTISHLRGAVKDTARHRPADQYRSPAAPGGHHSNHPVERCPTEQISRSISCPIRAPGDTISNLGATRREGRADCRVGSPWRPATGAAGLDRVTARGSNHDGGRAGRDCAWQVPVFRQMFQRCSELFSLIRHGATEDHGRSVPVPGSCKPCSIASRTSQVQAITVQCW